jgi:hypothetical protein
MDALPSPACGTHGKPVRPHRFWVVKKEDEKTGEKFRWERFIFGREDAKREEGTWRAIHRNPPSARRTGRDGRGMRRPEVQLSGALEGRAPTCKGGTWGTRRNNQRGIPRFARDDGSSEPQA